MSYWIPSLEDYDSHLLDKLRQIKVDIKGDGKLEPIHVSYFTPEPENSTDRDLSRPAIVLYMYDETSDITREQSIMSHTVTDTLTDTTRKRVPTPIKFFYQFTILTDYQQHMNEIIRQFNMLFPKRGYITLVDPGGEDVSYDFFWRSTSNGYTNQFLEYGANKPDRIFRKVYKYVLLTEIDEYQEHTYKKVLEPRHKVENMP